MTMRGLEVGEPGQGDEPGLDAPFTWHVHDDGSWGYGVKCTDCWTEKPAAGNTRPPEAVAWGPSTINPKVDQFLSTGDPSVFD